MKKAVVLISGGLDSTVLLAKAVKELGSTNVIALSIFYGQRHKKELECAKYQVEKYGVKWIQLDLSPIFANAKSSLMGNSNKELPKGSYQEQLEENKIVDTYIPYRNGLFLSVATSIAYSERADSVWYGAHLDDAKEGAVAYPDCSKEFVDLQNKTIWEGTGYSIRLEAPYVTNQMQKSDIVKLGHKLDVDFEHTWSCYDKKETHCGVCGTCIDRINAFKKAKIKDPTKYETRDVQG